MSTQNQSSQENSKGMDMFLLLVSFVIAWPALLLGMVTRWLIKQYITEPYPYWIGAGVFGAFGAFLLATRENPFPFLHILMNDITPLVFHMSTLTLIHFLLDAIPLWERSLFVFPWLALLLELFSPKNLHASLLAQERQRQALQTRKSQHAARRAARAPEQINGQAILGALIDNPNT